MTVVRRASKICCVAWNQGGFGSSLTAKGINDIDLYMLIAPTYDEYYSIHFDENGVADKIEMRVNIKGS